MAQVAPVALVAQVALAETLLIFCYGFRRLIRRLRDCTLNRAYREIREIRDLAFKVAALAEQEARVPVGAFVWLYLLQEIYVIQFRGDQGPVVVLAKTDLTVPPDRPDRPEIQEQLVQTEMEELSVPLDPLGQLDLPVVPVMQVLLVLPVLRVLSVPLGDL
jgi:hypothetical protein